MSEDRSAEVPAAGSASHAPPDQGPGGGGVPDLGYMVSIESFSGPMDLLLYLVRRTELDIVDIPIALIVDQFVATVRQWQDLDLDLAGDFILMAATLLELKARTIAPPPEGAEGETGDEEPFDPHASLIASLLAYRRFKEATQLLAGLDAEQAQRRQRQLCEIIPQDPDEDAAIELGALDVHLLMRTFDGIMARISGLGPRTVVFDDVPLVTRIEQLVESLRQRRSITMRELLGPAPARLVHVTTVMAVLECARQRLLEVAQGEQYGDITLRLCDAEELAQAPVLPPPEPEPPRRRRRLPLVTFAAPPGAADDAGAPADEPEEIPETDEQRFLRELQEATGVDALIARATDLEASFAAFWLERHPELAVKAAAPPEPPPAAVDSAPVAEAPPAPVAEPPSRPARKRPVPAATPAAAAIPAEPEPEPSATGAPLPAAATAEPETAAGAGAPAPEPVIIAATEPAAIPDAAVIPAEPEPETAATGAPLPAAATVDPEPETAAGAGASAPEPVAVAATEPAAIPDPDAGAAPPPMATEPAMADTRVAPAEPPPASPITAAASAIPTEAGCASTVAEIPTPAAETAAPAASASASTVETPAAEVETAAATPETSATASEPPAPAAAIATSAGTPTAEAEAPPAAAAPTPPATPVLARDDAAPLLSAQQEERLAAYAAALDEDADDAASDDVELVNAALQGDGGHPSLRSSVDAEQDEADEDSAEEDELADDPARVNAILLAQERRRAEAPASPAIIWTAPGLEQSAEPEQEPAAPAAVEPTPTAVEPASSAPGLPAGPVATLPPLTDTPASPVVDAPLVEARAAPSPIVQPALAPAAPAAVEVTPSSPAVVAPSVDSAVVDSAVQIAEPVPSALAPDQAPPSSTSPSIAAEAPAPAAATADDGIVALPTPTAASIETAVAAPAADAVAPEAASPPPAPAPIEIAPRPAAAPPIPIAASPAENAPIEAAIVAKATAPAAETIAAPRPQPIAPVQATGSVPSAEPEPATVPPAQPTATTRPSEPSSATEPPLAAVEPSAVEAMPPVRAPLAEALPAAEATAMAAAAPDQPAPASIPDGSAERRPPLPAAPEPPAPPGPPPPPPAAPPRSEPVPLPSSNPRPAHRTHPTMSPSTRSRTWLIAAIAALNAAWLAYAWLTWVPKDVIEVVAAPAAELEPRTPLRWTFNLDMVADQQLQQPPAVTPTMEPALAGSWTWHDRRTLEFTAARPLPEATTITVHLAKDALRSRDGFRLHGDLAQVMRTAPLAVLGAHVASFDADGHATVVMDFNQAVDPTLIAKRLAVAPVTAPDAAQPGPTRPDAAQPDPAQPAPGAGHPPAPAVVAADPTPGASVRLVVPAGAGPAQLRLPAGTTGTAGPLGLAAAWSTTLELGHVLAVTAASAEAPAHGDVVVHLATAPAGAPLELLADALSVTPAVPFRVVAGDGGLDLVGAFAPRTEYRVEVAARWPEADAPRHPLAAYPAAASLAVPIPVRRAGMWFPQDGFHDGRLAVASTAIGAATAEVFAAGDASPVRLPVASQELAWTPSGDDGTRTALIDGDTLLAGLPAGRYRLRLRSEDAEAAAAIETTVTVQDAAVRPLALLDGLASWLRAGMDGRGEADLRVRTVALAGE